MMFSIMIPCWNPNLSYLEQTLKSVTSQLNEKKNQITIVDDCSINSLEIVKLSKQYGVYYFRNEMEMGGCRTHNICIQKATEKLVHILHPDDWVLQNFYSNVLSGVLQVPDKALYATQAIWCDDHGYATQSDTPNWLRLNERTKKVEFQPLHEGNPLCVAAVVVTREAYEKYGVWDEHLVHCADWECWARMVTKGGGGSIPWPLACYRCHKENHSSRLMKTGENLRDYLRMAEICKGYMQVNDKLFRAMVRERAERQYTWFTQQGDNVSASHNFKLMMELS